MECFDGPPPRHIDDSETAYCPNRLSGQQYAPVHPLQLVIQSAQRAAMVPFGLGQELDGIAAGIASGIDLLNKFWQLGGRNILGLDPPQLPPQYTKSALGLIDGYHSIFWGGLILAIAQVEQFFVIKAVANWPTAIEHRFNQLIFAMYLLEGERTIRMIHHTHLTLSDPEIQSPLDLAEDLVLRYHSIFL